MDVQLGSTHRYSSVWTDAAGNPTTVDVRSPAVMAADDASRLTVVPDLDGLSGTITFASGIGPVQLQLTADADRGDGVRALTLVLDVTVIAGEAVAGTLELTPA